MKLLKYLDNMKNAEIPEDLQCTLLGASSIWTNDACYGYIIMAMEDAGYKKEDIHKVLHCARNAMDFATPEEAEKKWIDF